MGPSQGRPPPPKYPLLQLTTLENLGNCLVHTSCVLLQM